MLFFSIEEEVHSLREKKVKAYRQGILKKERLVVLFLICKLTIWKVTTSHKHSVNTFSF
jgi:hypothetical protein